MTKANAGIKLKDKFREERKRQRSLQKEYEISVYIPPLIAKICCELTCNNGIFSLKNGIIPDGKYIYIRTLEGDIYVAQESEVGHHSYLSNGKKVLSAGHFIFEKGKLCLVSNDSGHYMPSNEEMIPEIDFYYHISQNKDLIYEDHSKMPTQKLVSHYKAQEIIEKQTVDGLEPIATFTDKKSNFGKELLNQPSQQKPENAQGPQHSEVLISAQLRFFFTREELSHGYDDPDKIFIL